MDIDFIYMYIAVLHTSSSQIETLWLVPLVYMRHCSEEEFSRWVHHKIQKTFLYYTLDVICGWHPLNPWIWMFPGVSVSLVAFGLQVLPKRTNLPGISTTDRGGHRGGHTRGRGRGFRPPRYQNSSRGRFRYQSTRPQHQTPHPYYGGPSVGKRQWGHMDYHEQMPKRYPCLLLITPPSEELGAGSSGQHYPQQR